MKLTILYWCIIIYSHFVLIVVIFNYQKIKIRPSTHTGISFLSPYRLPAVGVCPNIKSSTKISSSKSHSSKSHLWMRNITKARRAAGLDYVGKNGMSMPGRCVKEPCPLACSIECRFNFTDYDRQKIHSHFWSLPKSEKDQFLLNHVVQLNPQRRRVVFKSLAEGRCVKQKKQFSYKYHLEINGGKGKRLQVCRKFFASTLDLSRNHFYRLFEANKAEVQGES